MKKYLSLLHLLGMMLRTGCSGPWPFPSATGTEHRNYAAQFKVVKRHN